MKRGHDRHLETGNESGDIAAGIAAENAVLVLKRNDFDSCGIQEFCRANVVDHHIVANLESDGLRKFVGAAGIGHGDHRGFEVRSGFRDRAM